MLKLTIHFGNYRGYVHVELIETNFGKRPNDQTNKGFKL